MGRLLSRCHIFFRWEEGLPCRASEGNWEGSSSHFSKGCCYFVFWCSITSVSIPSAEHVYDPYLRGGDFHELYENSWWQNFISLCPLSLPASYLESGPQKFLIWNTLPLVKSVWWKCSSLSLKSQGPSLPESSSLCWHCYSSICAPPWKEWDGGEFFIQSTLVT